MHITVGQKINHGKVPAERLMLRVMKVLLRLRAKKVLVLRVMKVLLRLRAKKVLVLRVMRVLLRLRAKKVLVLRVMRVLRLRVKVLVPRAMKTTGLSNPSMYVSA